MNADNVAKCLAAILPGGLERQRMLDGYRRMNDTLGGPGASSRAAKAMIQILTKK